MNEIEKFNKLRLDLFEEIKIALDEDGYCKSYEGCFEISKIYPNYFEERDNNGGVSYKIQLHCYVVGPSRHYEWYGKTFKEAIDLCDKEVRSWFASSGRGSTPVTK